jgi:hypothetical protein
MPRSSDYFESQENSSPNVGENSSVHREFVKEIINIDNSVITKNSASARSIT